MFCNSSLPRLLLHYAGGNTTALESFDPDDREAMLRFFIRHGYLQTDRAGSSPVVSADRSTALPDLKLTSKGAWLLNQLRNRSSSMPLFQPA